jgi:dTDP-4-dehydrorhamnose reductase
MSTDYVFDGVKGNYSESSKPNPVGFYGYTKYLGEQAIVNRSHYDDIIVRTTVLYGGNKPDFVTKILDQIKSKQHFRVTTKVIGSPTYIPHLAEALIKLCEVPQSPRIVNIVGEDIMSRYDFAIMIANVWELDTGLIQPTKEVPGEAHRPLLGGLKTTLAKRLGLPIYTTLDGLRSMKIRMENK